MSAAGEGSPTMTETKPPEIPLLSSGTNSYTKVRQIGEGSFGAAFVVSSSADGQQYVMKEINTSKMAANDHEEATKEVRLLARLQHPYIVAYRDSFQLGGSLYLVMDYCDGGDLHSRITHNSATGTYFTEDVILDWFVQICLAVKHIHDQRILHRDIKSQNIFLTRGNVAKLGDFGIARVLQSTLELAETRVGTPYYLSPEICESKPYNNKSDVWALGCVLYEMAALRHAFVARNMKGLVLKIVRGSCPPLPPRYSLDLRHLVQLMFRRLPKDRPSINSVLSRPFLERRVRKFLPQEFTQPEVRRRTNKEFNLHIGTGNAHRPRKQTTSASCVTDPAMKYGTPPPPSAPPAMTTSSRSSDGSRSRLVKSRAKSVSNLLSLPQSEPTPGAKLSSEAKRPSATVSPMILSEATNRNIQIASAPTARARSTDPEPPALADAGSANAHGCSESSHWQCGCHFISLGILARRARPSEPEVAVRRINSIEAATAMHAGMQAGLGLDTQADEESNAGLKPRPKWRAAPECLSALMNATLEVPGHLMEATIDHDTVLEIASVRNALRATYTIRGELPNELSVDACVHGGPAAASADSSVLVEGLLPLLPPPPVLAPDALMSTCLLTARSDEQDNLSKLPCLQPQQVCLAPQIGHTPVQALNRTTSLPELQTPWQVRSSDDRTAPRVVASTRNTDAVLGDSAFSRLEGWRIQLEKQLGVDAFLKVYRILQSSLDLPLSEQQDAWRTAVAEVPKHQTLLEVKDGEPVDEDGLVHSVWKLVLADCVYRID